MRKEEKNQLVDVLVEKLNNSQIIYLTDISDLNAQDTSNLRRQCFKRDIRLSVVKNTLLRLAMEKSEKDLEGFYGILKGPTSLMFAATGNGPAKLIKELRRTSSKPVLKGAFVEEMTYLGDDQLDFLVNIKSRDELLADLIGLLQSPAKNVISALQSGGRNLTGILKTLSEKEDK